LNGAICGSVGSEEVGGQWSGVCPAWVPKVFPAKCRLIKCLIKVQPPTNRKPTMAIAYDWKANDV